MVEGGRVVSGGKFSVGECAVEEGAVKERTSSHVRLTEHHSGRDAVSPLFLALDGCFLHVWPVYWVCIKAWSAAFPTAPLLTRYREARIPSHWGGSRYVESF